MQPAYQTDFSAANGNALQACFASIFDCGLSDVPNFIKAGSDYLTAIDAWLAPRRLVFVKVDLIRNSGRLEFPAGPAICILAGPSPRGDFKHAVVGRVLQRDAASAIGTDFEIVHDPHPDATNLAGPALWAGFFAVRDTGSQD